MTSHIILFEKFNQYAEIEALVDFVGYHCSPYYIQEFTGSIEHTEMNKYGREWFPRVLDALGWVKQLSTMPDLSSDNPKADKWYSMVESMLYKRNIRWIFVARHSPKTMYGKYEYGVTINSSKVLAVLDDVNEIDSDIYIYNCKKVNPVMIPLFEQPKKQQVISSGSFTPDKNQEGLGLFKKSDKYSFPWERSYSEYNDDIQSAKHFAQYSGEKYPHYLSTENEKVICALLNIKPYSVSQHEVLTRFKEYMQAQ